MKRLLAYFLKMTPMRIAIALTVLVIAADWTEPLFLQTIDLKALDIKFKTRGIQKPSENVAIIAIDEKSISELGRWPWPRTTHAKLIDRLKAAGAKAVGFDIVFSEADQNSELVKMQELLKTYKDLGLDKQPSFSTLPQEYAMEASVSVKSLITSNNRFYRHLVDSEAEANSDEYFAHAIAGFKDNVVLGYFFFGGTASEDDIAINKANQFDDTLIDPSRVGLVSTFGAAPIEKQNMSAVVPNIAMLSKATDNYGHFYMLPDAEDGTIRWNDLVLLYNDNFYPSLGLKIASVALDKPIMIKLFDGLVNEIRLGDVVIPTDERGRVMVNYAGPLSLGNKNDITFKIYSFSDILNKKIPDAELKDKVFVVGPTAVGIYDLRNTPFDTAYPGVGVHANVISNILTQQFLQKPVWMKLFDSAIIIVIGLFLGFVLGKLRGLQGALTAATVAGIYLLFTQYAFTEWGIWLSTVYPELEIISVFAAIVTYKYMTEERQAKAIRGAFSNYVTPSVVDQVLKDPTRLKLGGEMRDLTVMFSDIRGFTTISEKLTPEQLVDLLNAYLSKMTDLVFKFDGTLDKYIGDALMAIWGAPVDQPDHAIRACHTAIEMMDLLEKELKPKWQNEGLKHIAAGQIPDVSIGIGLNSGSMSVGNMGSDQRFDYTVMGDNVNLASRLEGTNKNYGTNIIISEFTLERAREAVVVRELDFVKVKGKLDPVRIFELVGKAGAVDEATLEKVALFEKGLAYYRKCEWDLAESTFKAVLERFPADETSKIFLHRVEDNRHAGLPPDWDGVYEMKTK